MKIAIFILVLLAIVCIVIFTRSLWDRPKETVDMMKKFDTIVKAGLAQGPNAKVIEIRDNFIKVGKRDHTGERAFMVKQRPENEFRVLYNREYDSEFKDVKIQHVYPDSADQAEIVAQFLKEIKESEVRR